MKNKFSQLASQYLKLAQHMSAQSADIEQALKASNLWDKGNEVARLLQTNKVPDDITLKIGMVIDKALNVNFIVRSSKPTDTTATLALALKNTYALPMKKALQNAKINVNDKVQVNWLAF